MNLGQFHTGYSGPNMIPVGQGHLFPGYSVPIQNSFAPLGEWVGLSMGINNDNDNGVHESMDVQTAQSKRRRCNTGTDNATFASLSMDDKISLMFDKLNHVEQTGEQTNKTVANIAQSLHQASSQIGLMNTRMSGHEQFLKLIAYKSIDSEARSRRRNLIFHGLAEMKNEDCSYKLSEFLWYEMGLEMDDLYIERIHRLGSLQKARQTVTSADQPIRRPIIVAFNDTKSVNKVLDNAHMLRGSGFSVTRDFPQEIVKARRGLMPRYIQEKQNRQNKVTIEYPARIVVNGKTITDAFPDWHTVLHKDRYEMVNSLSQTVNMNFAVNNGQQACPQNPQPPIPPSSPPPRLPQPQQNVQAAQIRPPPPTAQSTGVRSQPVPGGSNTGVTGTINTRATVPGYKSYSQVVSMGTQQTTVTNVPRYTSMTTGNQPNTQQAHAATTVSSTSGQLGSVNTRVLADNAVNGATVTRDQPTYQHL